MEDDKQEIIEQPAANSERSEGSAKGHDATTDEVASLYNDLGIKAPVPTDSAKRRPKTTKVRTEDSEKKDPGSADNDGKSKGGRKAEDSDDKDKSKNAPNSNSDGDAGDAADSKTPKNSSKDGKIQDESEEAGKGVRKDKSESEGDSKPGGEGDADGSDKRTGQEAHESGDSEEEGEDDEQGKRPGKSNPAVEQRIQKLANEKKEAIERAENLEKQLREVTQKQVQEKISQEDPEYKMEDFRKVRDDEGNIHELDDNQAELAYRRWKDGYDARKEERNAAMNREEAIENYKREAQETLMRSSAEAYDTLTDILDKFPELKVDSGKFDKEFSGKVMPLIEDMIIYQRGTEPGNEAGKQPVIIGMSMNPTKMLKVINEIKTQKRNLPLNGLNDTVDTRSDVNVPHSRSSDSTVNQANDLYKHLGINKRLK